MKPTTGKLIRALILGLFLSSIGAAYGASITGTIVYEGDVPKLRALKMDADPVCHMKHAEPPKVEILVLGKDKTMANVFVHIKSGLPDKEYPVPEKPVVIDQVGCMYVPHVIGIQANQTLEVRNSDGVLHNIHALPKTNRAFNQAMPKSLTKAEKTFTKAEFMFPIKCDVHPWMAAWCAVMSHPYFDVTEKDGKFSIEGLEAGTYEIEAWHERLGTRTATIEVTADETKTADFSFAIPKK